MRTFKRNRRKFRLVFTAVLCTAVILFRSLADDKEASNPPAKPAPAVPDSWAPLTERERWMLDRMEQLEKRVAELEAKGNPPAAPAALASATQPASSTAIDPSSSATVAATAPGTNVIPPDRAVAAGGGCKKKRPQPSRRRQNPLPSRTSPG